MIKRKFYSCVVIAHAKFSIKKNPACCWIFKFQMAEVDQLPSQLAQGMRLKIRTKPTAYIM